MTNASMVSGRLMVSRRLMLSGRLTSAFALGLLIAGPIRAQPMMTVPAGSRLLVRMTNSLDSSRDRVGTIFTAALVANLQVGNTVVAPAGTVVHGRLTNANSGGRLAGRSELRLELTDIIINGSPFPLLTGDYSVQGSNAAGSTARRTLGGAGLGAIIGGIAGNAGVGAAIGATGGGVASIATRGEQIRIPSETLLEFRLQQPASLPAPRG